MRAYMVMRSTAGGKERAFMARALDCAISSGCENYLAQRLHGSGMSHSSSGDDLWCRRYRPAANAAARLVCLPHAGGSAPFFLPVSAALSPAGVDVLAIQYPGRQDRRAEPPIGDMAVLADRLYGVLRRQPEMPTTLFGHSMGAILGFEVARRLEAAGRGPVHLFVSGRRGPATFRDERIHQRDDAGILAELRKMNGTA